MKVSKSCYAITGLGYFPPWVVNCGFIAGQEKTLVVDSSGTYLSAQTVYGYAKAVRPENEVILLNTEKHLDHIGGNCLFDEKGIAIYGHRLNRRKEDDLNGDIDIFNCSILEKDRREAHEENIFYQKTKIINPSIYVEDGMIFRLGDLEAQIIFTPGHTETNISVHVPSEKVIFTGDVVVQGYFPNLLNSDLNGWKQWINSLDIITSLGVQAIVPGHGNVILKEEVNEEIARIRKILLDSIDKAKG